MEPKPKYAAILLTRDGNVLVGRRAFGSTDPSGQMYATTVGGGKVEPGEDPLDAAIREADEETFHQVKVDRARLRGPHMHKGNKFDSYFWVYELPESDIMDLNWMNTLATTHSELAALATTPEERKNARKYTEFSEFAWEPISSFMANKSPVHWPIFPPTLGALRNMKW